MDEEHFRPPRPARTARILGALAALVLVGGLVGWSQAGWPVAAACVVATVTLAVAAVRLARVELIVRTSGIEVVDITGRRRQAWVGTKRLLIDFSRPRPVLEIDAPGPSQPYRSTLVLAGLEAAEHTATRERLEEVVRAWAGPGVAVEFRPVGAGPTGPAAS